MSRWPSRRGGRIQQLTAAEIAAAAAQEAEAARVAYQAGYRHGVYGYPMQWAGRPAWDRYCVGFAIGQQDREMLCPTPA